MKLVIRKRFLKELADLPAKDRKRIEVFVFEELKDCNTFNNVKGIEKLTGYTSFYKIRFGDYRVGIRFENDEFTLERVMHRKEIYKFFP